MPQLTKVQWHPYHLFRNRADDRADLLDDPEIDVVYVPLPIFLHYEWTMKALAAGKHVLVEKPSACTVEETRAMFALANEKALVLMEAFHYRYIDMYTRMTVS